MIHRHITYTLEYNNVYRPPEGIEIWNRGCDPETGRITHSDIRLKDREISIHLYSTDKDPKV